MVLSKMKILNGIKNITFETQWHVYYYLYTRHHFNDCLWLEVFLSEDVLRWKRSTGCSDLLLACPSEQIPPFISLSLVNELFNVSTLSFVSINPYFFRISKTVILKSYCISDLTHKGKQMSTD